MSISKHQAENSSNQCNQESDQHYLVEVNRQPKCICQLCDCGKHRCPRPRIRGEFETTYKTNFKNIVNPQPMHLNSSYRYQQRHYQPESLRTNYQETYLPKSRVTEAEEMTSSRLQNIGKSIVRSSAPFMGSSSYKDQYKSFKIQSIPENPEQPKVTPSKHLSPAKFEGISSYKSTFNSPPPVKVQPYNQRYKKLEIPFQGESSYKSQFQNIILKPSNEQRYEPMPMNNKPRVKFEDSTSYKDHYPGIKIKAAEDYPIVKKCKFSGIDIPTYSDENQPRHVFYDEKNHQFV